MQDQWTTRSGRRVASLQYPGSQGTELQHLSPAVLVFPLAVQFGIPVLGSLIERLLLVTVSNRTSRIETLLYRSASFVGNKFC
jgi:hypothetical protein